MVTPITVPQGTGPLTTITDNRLKGKNKEDIMKLHKNMFLIAASALALTVAAPAFAADDAPTYGPADAPIVPHIDPMHPNWGVIGTREHPRTGTRVYGVGLGYQWIPAQNTVPEELIGANVVDSQNDIVGTVKNVIYKNGHSQLIFSAGQYMGLGSHDVALNMDQTRIYHHRNDRLDYRVATNMTDEQLMALPAYKAPKTGSSMKKTDDSMK